MREPQFLLQILAEALKLSCPVSAILAAVVDLLNVMGDINANHHAVESGEGLGHVDDTKVPAAIA